MTLQMRTVVDSISQLSISGLTIKDADTIPQGLNDRDLPMLMPDPIDLITDFQVRVDSFGMAAERKLTVSYRLKYLLVYAQVGAGRTATIEKYEGRLNMILSILDAILAIDALTGALEIMPELAPGTMTIDIGGVQYTAAGIYFRVSEFID